jgi:soluble P-type ATPase
MRKTACARCSAAFVALRWRSKFAQHLIDNKHAIGNMEDIMEVIHMEKKGKMLDTLEGFHIYKETKAGNQINDKLTVRENAIFETTVQEDPYRGSTAPPQPNT